MTFNPPAKVRAILYVATAVGSVVVAYLKVKGYIGDAEIALWGGLVTVVNSMAALNTNVGDK